MIKTRTFVSAAVFTWAILAISGCGSDANVGSLLGRGMPVALGVLFVAGLLTALTPCVYPMIPITIGIFGARKAKSKTTAFMLSTSYGAGIAATYTALGMFASFTGLTFGAYLSNRAFVVAIVLIFAILALSMAGLYEIRLPSRFSDKLSRVGGQGMIGAFMMGTVAGIIAAPCTGPVLAGILAWVATTKSVGTGVVLLLAYSFGLATPFIILGTFSGLITSLPKSGTWMEVVRSFFAVVMFTVAIWFLAGAFPAISRPFSKTLPGLVMSGLLVTIGVASGGLHLEISYAPFMTKLRKVVSAFAIGIGIFGVLAWASTGDGMRSPQWRMEFKKEIPAAVKSGSPAIIDFYADWCAACKELDRSTWSDEKVITESKRFIMIKVDETESNETTEKIMDDFEIVGLPAVIFIGSNGKPVDDLKTTSFIPPEEMLEKMRTVR